tara:strand:+ start:9816 stop:10178 length:363 start_codon:yes stop_codon:yes gene_type:complete
MTDQVAAPYSRNIKCSDLPAHLKKVIETCVERAGHDEGVSANILERTLKGIVVFNVLPGSMYKTGETDTKHTLCTLEPIEDIQRHYGVATLGRGDQWNDARGQAIALSRALRHPNNEYKG